MDLLHFLTQSSHDYPDHKNNQILLLLGPIGKFVQIRWMMCSSRKEGCHGNRASRQIEPRPREGWTRQQCFFANFHRNIFDTGLAYWVWTVILGISTFQTKTHLFSFDHFAVGGILGVLRFVSEQSFNSRQNEGYRYQYKTRGNFPRNGGVRSYGIPRTQLF